MKRCRPPSSLLPYPPPPHPTLNSRLACYTCSVRDWMSLSSSRAFPLPNAASESRIPGPRARARCYQRGARRARDLFPPRPFPPPLLRSCYAAYLVPSLSRPELARGGRLKLIVCASRSLLSWRRARDFWPLFFSVSLLPPFLSCPVSSPCFLPLVLPDFIVPSRSVAPLLFETSCCSACDGETSEQCRAHPWKARRRLCLKPRCLRTT